MLRFFITILILEIYKYYKGYSCWEHCYHNNIVYTYSDFLKYELNSLKWYILFSVLFCYIYYMILLINLFFIFFYIIIPIEVSTGGRVKNIFIYNPYLTSQLIKKIIKKKLYDKKIIKILFLNYINISIYFFPRIVMHYSHKTTKILKSYKKKPNKNIKDFNDFLSYVYKDTYDENIKKLEKILKYPI